MSKASAVAAVKTLTANLHWASWDPHPGMIPCTLCRTPTRIRLNGNGQAMCMLCVADLQELAQSKCEWSSPKKFRISTRVSTKKHVVFRGGAANGDYLRRDVGSPPPPLTERDGCWYVFDPVDDCYYHHHGKGGSDGK